MLLAMVAGGGGYVWSFARYTEPGPLSVERLLVVPAGTGVRSIATQLEQERVISDSLVFRVAVRARRDGRRLQAGEYRFQAGVNMQSVINLLISGKTVVRKVTIPEGLSSDQVISLLQRTEGLSGNVEAPAEGSLLPSTYHFSFGDGRDELVVRMSRALDQAMAELWLKRKPNLPFQTPREAVVLASIVEKETGLEGERRRIAGVFVNRLRKGMKLQSDPTVIYALAKGRGSLGRLLERRDLAVQSAYNTYLHKGLPPAPIANPGLAALKAVLNPLATRELYFVADGSGGHVFARTLKEHQRNVQRWRRIRSQRKTP